MQICNLLSNLNQTEPEGEHSKRQEFLQVSWQGLLRRGKKIQKLSLKEVAAWPHHWIAMTKFHRTEPAEAPAAGKATARLCIFLGITINWSWGTNVALLVPVLKDYLSQPAGSALFPSLSVPHWQPWGPAGLGTAARLVRGQKNQLKAVVEPPLFSRISESYDLSEMSVPTVLTTAFLKYKRIFFALGTKEFYAELTE